MRTTQLGAATLPWFRWILDVFASSFFSISQYNIRSADSMYPIDDAPEAVASICSAMMFPNVTLWGACAFSLTMKTNGAVRAITFILSLTGSTAGSAALFGLFKYSAMFLTTGLMAALWIGGNRLVSPPFDLISWWNRAMYVPVAIPYVQCVTEPIPSDILDSRLPVPPPVADHDAQVLLTDLGGDLEGFPTPWRSRSVTPSVVSSEAEIAAKPVRRSRTILIQNLPEMRLPKRPHKGKI